MQENHHRAGKKMVESTTQQQLHVAMFPWLAFGHINPFIQLSNNLSSRGIKISFFSTPANIPKIKESLMISSPNIQIFPFTLPSVPGLQPGLENTSDMPPPMAEPLKIALDLTQPQIKSLLTQLRPHIILFDFAQPWIPDLVSDLGIKSVFFSVFSAAFMSSFIGRRCSEGGVGVPPPTVDELKNLPKGHPRSSSIRFQTFQARKYMYGYTSFAGGYRIIDRVQIGQEACDAIVYKACIDMESPYIDFLRTQSGGKPILLTGPALPTSSSATADQSRFAPNQLRAASLDESGNGSSIADFLDRFPPKTVVFCSFGSESFLEPDQVHEVALGLELTGLPFLLVLNFVDPAAKDDAGRAVRDALPSGFLERVKNRGMVTSGWVPQKEILSHESVGCYVCHSGFSSVMEAIVADCQLVLVPLKGDQFMNSKLLSLDMESGVEVNRRDEDGHFGKLDICEAVKEVMVDIDKEPGRTVRANQVKWRDFFMNRDVHEGYVDRFVEELEKLVWGDQHYRGNRDGSTV